MTLLRLLHRAASPVLFLIGVQVDRLANRLPVCPPRVEPRHTSRFHVDER